MRIEDRGGYWAGQFQAMASPCELLMEVESEAEARGIADAAAAEALRIEQKFSRYRDDNLVHRINNPGGSSVEVDDEFADLLDFAERCWALSDGRFDITSGVLRNLWRFDGSSSTPAPDAVDKLLRHVGWNKLTWRRPFLTLPQGMEIDLGGIGKEYAVDRAASVASELTASSVLVNFGGDLAVTAPRREDRAWQVGIEQPDTPDTAVHAIDIRRGALATSGDAKRFIMARGRRYSHILDPLTGWPVDGAPRSVTVLAGTCTEAGLMATLAMLQGPDAETFLEAQGVQFWCLR